MKKGISLFLAALLLLTGVMPAFAAEPFTEPVKLIISGQGNANSCFRFVTDLKSFPFEVTENSLAGCKITGEWKHKKTGEVVKLDSTVKANEMRENSTVLVVNPTDSVKVKDIDYTTNNEYTFDFTLTYGEPTEAPSEPAKPAEKPSETPAASDEKLALHDGETLILLKAEDFAKDIGTWTIANGIQGATMNVLFGKDTQKPEECKPANATVKIEKDGTYYIWVRALDYSENQPATRYFSVAVNGEQLSENGGTHKTQGWKWQLLGSKELKAGDNTVSVIDSSAFYPRCEAVAITSDKDFSGPGESELIAAMNKYGVGEKTEIQTPTNKLGKAVLLYLGSAKAFAAGKETKVDADNDAVVPFTENDRTLVPVRFIAESFGAKVDWNEQTQTVSMTVGSKTISMVLGESKMTVNSKEVALDAPANTYNDRTFIPLRAMAEAIGKNVFWDDRGLIIISDVTFDATMDKDLIDSAVAAFGGKVLDFAVVDEDLSGYQGTVGENDYKLDYFNASEFNERDGMINIITKLKNGEKVTVGFLGGSITMQDGWRGKTLEWLKNQYKNAEINEVDVSLSGTGADLAVCRTDDEIVEHNPDLVFVEYAVNGGTEQNMEGIVRKIWKNNPKTDICFVYTITTAMLPMYQAGGLPTVAKSFENVANYYGIPSVAFGFQIADLYTKGELTPKAASPEAGKILFSNDGTHPTMDGSILYAGAVARSIATMDKHTAKTEFVHELKAPLHEDNWENAKRVSYDKATFSGDWKEYTAENGGYGADFPYTGGYLPTLVKLFPKMMGTKTAGSSFTVKFTGTTVGFFDIGGTFAGQILASVDGGEPVVLNRHTPYSSRLRHQYVFIPEQPYGEHTVTFTLDSNKPDKSAMSDYAQNKAEYDKNEFYFGSILVVGEIQ